MNEYSLTVYRKTEKEFTLYISNFNSSDSMTEARFRDTLGMNIDETKISFLTTVSATFEDEETMTLGEAVVIITPTVITVDATLSDDGYGKPSPTSTNGTYSDTTLPLYMGNITPGQTGGKTKTYIPFALDVNQGIDISYATLILDAYTSQSKTAVKIRVACENADDSTPPTNVTGWSDLNSRTSTVSYYSSTAVPAWNDKTLHYFDITDAVQEVINRSGWVFGNTIGVIISDFGSTSLSSRQIASTRAADADPTYDPPVLEVVYGGTGYSFDTATTTAGKSWAVGSGGLTTTAKYDYWSARIEITRPIQLSDVVIDLGAADTYTLTITDDSSNILYSLGNKTIATRTADVTWSFASPTVFSPGIYRFVLTPIVSEKIDYVKQAPLYDYGFFNYLNTYFKTTSQNFTLPIQLVAYVHV